MEETSARYLPGPGQGLDQACDTPLYLQLYEQLAQSIRTGALQPADRLPSIRATARELGVSHITVEKAYLQLATEGFVRSVPRSGYVVESFDASFLDMDRPDNAKDVERVVQAAQWDGFHLDSAAGGACRYDFAWARLAPDSFPAREWARLATAVLSSGDDALTCAYPDMRQPTHLQRALAAYLKRTRGVSCHPLQIVVGNGTGNCLSTLFDVLDATGGVLAIDEPCWPVARAVAHERGLLTHPLPVLPGGSVACDDFLRALGEVQPVAAFTTPSNQFPSGLVMPLDVRIELLKRAATQGFYVIEDDSCSEFRYTTRTTPSLHSMDTFNRVVYLGNFSKVLSPGLRVAYMVLPPDLLERYLQTERSFFPAVSMLEQEVLARFLESGGMAAHVRRMAAIYRKRHDHMLRALTDRMGYRISLSGMDSGLHFLMSVHNNMTESELLESARKQGANVYGTSQCWSQPSRQEPHLMVGFSSMPIYDFEPAVAALARAWFD